MRSSIYNPMIMMMAAPTESAKIADNYNSMESAKVDKVPEPMMLLDNNGIPSNSKIAKGRIQRVLTSESWAMRSASGTRCST